LMRKVVDPVKPKKASVAGVVLSNYRSGKVLEILVQLNFKGSFAEPNYTYYTEMLTFRFDTATETLRDLKAKVLAAWENHNTVADVSMADLIYALEQYVEA